MRERAGADGERAVGECLREGGDLARTGEELRSADRGTGFAPVWFVGGYDRKASKAEVGHGAGCGSNVKGIARRDEDDFDAIALFRCEQDIILELGCTNPRGSIWFCREQAVLRHFMRAESIGSVISSVPYLPVCQS